MRFTNTSNPALSEKVLQRTAENYQAGQGTMTVNGAIHRTLVMLGIVLVTASFVWGQFTQNPASVQGWMIFGAIGGLITAIVTVFKQEWAPISGPIYAALEGLFLGGISAFFNSMYPGIVMQAVGLTFAVTMVMLMLYRTGVIQVTQKFRMGVFAATGGIALFYLFSFVLSMFGVDLAIMHSSGPFGIIFSIVVVVIAALNLALDFDFIDKAAEARAPKYVEWYAAFGLMVTLIWLYIEILRLLSRFASND